MYTIYVWWARVGESAKERKKSERNTSSLLCGSLFSRRQRAREWLRGASTRKQSVKSHSRRVTIHQLTSGRGLSLATEFPSLWRYLYIGIEVVDGRESEPQPARWTGSSTRHIHARGLDLKAWMWANSPVACILLAPFAQDRGFFEAPWVGASRGESGKGVERVNYFVNIVYSCDCIMFSRFLLWI